MERNRQYRDGMSNAEITRRWSPQAFLKAWDDGEFEGRVELVGGEVIPVVIGDWHGEQTFRVARLLPDDGVAITQATLPVGESLPDPDCWVRRADAEPSGMIGHRLKCWHPSDVLLVIEVSEETVAFDLTVKARLYASLGHPEYWAITRTCIHRHTDPRPNGYRTRTELHPGDQLPVPYGNSQLAVADVLLAS